MSVTWELIRNANSSASSAVCIFMCFPGDSAAHKVRAIAQKVIDLTMYQNVSVVTRDGCPTITRKKNTVQQRF